MKAITIILLAVSVGLAGCNTAKEAASVGTDVYELRESFERADALVDEYASTLPKDKAERLKSEWAQIEQVREYVRGTDPQTIVRHYEQFASQYWKARAAYSNIRDIAAPELNRLPQEDRLFVERLDQTALSLDDSVQTLSDDPDGRKQALLEILRIGSGLAQALPAVL